nr:EOG090X0BWU [Artemia franciscana]
MKLSGMGIEQSYEAENNFVIKENSTKTKFLEPYLIKVAKNGDPKYAWSHLKPILKERIEGVLTTLQETTPEVPAVKQVPFLTPFIYEVISKSLLFLFNYFNQTAPFTIQRVCELLLHPEKHYKRIDKFMRGLEKNLLVVGTVEPGIRSNRVNINSPKSYDLCLRNMSDNSSEPEPKRSKILASAVALKKIRAINYIYFLLNDMEKPSKQPESRADTIFPFSLDKNVQAPEISFDLGLLKEKVQQELEKKFPHDLDRFGMALFCEYIYIYILAVGVALRATPTPSWWGASRPPKYPRARKSLRAILVMRHCSCVPTKSIRYVIKLTGLNATSYIMSIGSAKKMQLLQMAILYFDKGLQQFGNLKKENQNLKP